MWENNFLVATEGKLLLRFPICRSLLPHHKFRGKVWCFLFLFVCLIFHVVVPVRPAISSQSTSEPAIILGDPNFFPIGVWLQSPGNAAKFKELGINLYVGLWKGPNTVQLQELKKAGMPVICHQNNIALQDINDDIILGWLQQDEPDNSQERTFGLFSNPPVPPLEVLARYKTLRSNAPQKPVLLNFGQGIAWDQWEGRGTRTNHPEDYKEYVKGGDIISFDIYPVTHRNPSVRGRLEFVALGVQRLKSLISPEQKVWNVIGVSRVNDPDLKPTPFQVRSQVWMSIIHGSSGIIYFVHQFKPRFSEAAIFEDSEMMHEVQQLNNLIKSLDVALNSPNTNDIRRLVTASPEAPVAAITKRHGSFLYLLSVAMRNQGTTSSFEFRHAIPDQYAEVLGENRKIKIKNGILEDHYKPYEPHIYKIDYTPIHKSK